MIELVRFRHPQPAHLLVAALRAEGIAARIREEQGETALYLEDAARFDDARALVAQFLQNPDDPRFAGAAWQASAPAAARRRGRSASDAQAVQPPLFSGAWLASMGPVTRLVLGLTLVVFVMQQFMGPQVYRYLMFPPALEGLASQPWRLITPMLLHFGVLHLAFNLLWWMELGRIIERFQSSAQLVWVTLATAAVSALAQFLSTGPAFGGLSGVVYGLLGYLWIYGKVNPDAGYGLRREIVLFMLAWLVICYVGLAGIVANEAHLFGLLTGCALGAITGWYRRKRFYKQ